MKALVYTAPRTLELQDLPSPHNGPSDALVQVRASGVCGSDLDGFLGRSRKRIPPLVLGHEFSGEIAQLGNEVPDFRVGDRVAVYPLVVCGQCRYCVSGREQICPDRKVYGLDFHGGLAEYVAAPGRSLFHLPEPLNFVEGALVEPLANALHVINSVPAIEGATGVIFGGGPIGTMVFWAAKYFGARGVAVVEVNPHRIVRLRHLGVDFVIDGSHDPVRSLFEWTHGSGADFAVDAVGKPECRANTVRSLSPGGVAVWIGLSGDEAEIDGRAVVTRELEVKGSYAYRRDDFARAISILAEGKLPVHAFVDERRLESGQSSFEALATGKSSVMKLVFSI